MFEIILGKSGCMEHLGLSVPSKQKCPFSEGSFSKNYKNTKILFIISLPFSMRRFQLINSPDFSVRQKNISSRNSKMDIYKCPNSKSHGVFKTGYFY